MGKDKKIAVIAIVAGTLLVAANPKEGKDSLNTPSYRTLGMVAMIGGAVYYLFNYKK